MFYPSKLETMDIRSKETMLKFLKEVVSWTGDYYLEEGIETTGPRQVRIGCRVVFVGDDAPQPTEWTYAEYSFLMDWDQREIVVPAIDVNSERSCRFSESAMEWYLANRKLSEHDIRVLLGKKLYRRFLDRQESQAFDVERIAHQLHLTPQQVFDQARVLVHLGYAESRRSGRIWGPGMPVPPPLTPTQELGTYKLSSEGHRWIAAGTPEESLAGAPQVTVNVDVHVAVTNTIQAAQRSDVDDATKERFELMMRRLEAELQKPDGEGNMETVKDVLDVANNAKGLLGPAIGFLAQHWDKIERFSGMMF